MLGLPPVWYKAAPYRSRAVKDPRGVLDDFGVTLPKDTEIRVWDSTAETRFLVLPMRPAGTDGWSEEQLAEIVTRDSMIGTGLPESEEAGMNGVHDMGGMDGFGKVEVEQNEPPFHEPWEGRVHGDEPRHGRDRRLEHRHGPLLARIAAAAGLSRRDLLPEMVSRAAQHCWSSAASSTPTRSRPAMRCAPASR